MLPSVRRFVRCLPVLFLTLATWGSAGVRPLPPSPVDPSAPAPVPAPLPTPVSVALPAKGPIVDAHVHLLSPAGAARLRARLGAEALEATVRDAGRVVAMLDSAGTRRALLVSDAYELGSPRLRGPGEEAAVRAENEWVAAQAARAPERLVPFCSVDPLRAYALREVARCGAVLHVRGLKLHLAGSGVDLRRPGDVERLRAVFAAADRERLALLVHLRTLRPAYGAPDVRIFLERVLPAAPDVPVQIAHLGGWGGYDRATDAALAEFAAALAAGTLPRSGANLWFDLAFVAPPATQPEPAAGARLLRRLRRIGAAHLVFGSDWPLGSSAGSAAELRAELAADPPLAAAILASVPPYLR